jgi:hypothetical protein
MPAGAFMVSEWMIENSLSILWHTGIWFCYIKPETHTIYQASTLTYFSTCPFGQLTKKSTCPTQSFSCPKKLIKITKTRE